MPLQLMAGDVFAVENPMILGRAINAAQLFWSDDNEATYSHNGIITDPTGKTLETLWTVREQNLYDRYAGKRVLVARPDSPEPFIRSAIDQIRKDHLGQWYPAWRLPLHLIPPFAKYLTIGGRFLVCSELTAKFLFLAGARHGQYTGTRPDTLADEWRHGRRYTVLFEDYLEE